MSTSCASSCALASLSSLLGTEEEEEEGSAAAAVALEGTGSAEAEAVVALVPAVLSVRAVDQTAIMVLVQATRASPMAARSEAAQAR